MNTLDALLEGLHLDPVDDTTRLILADWLEDNDFAGEAELLRLHLKLRGPWESGPPQQAFHRVCQLLRSGVKPVVPTRVNSLGMEFALIRPGLFWMGSPPNEPHRFRDEGPEHLVHITKPFYLGIYPVTQRQFETVCNQNPSCFRLGGEGENKVVNQDTSFHPVEMVSWEMAVDFCARLNALPDERAAGRKYRLPTEAEWEYACRGGISRGGPYHWGAKISADLASIRPGDLIDPDGEPAIERTNPVDHFPPNIFGLYDLHGNVSEWCADWFHPEYYAESPFGDPKGPSSGEFRVLRGGCWKDGLDFARTAFRYDRPPDQARNDFGLRVLLEHPREEIRANQATKRKKSPM